MFRKAVNSLSPEEAMDKDRLPMLTSDRWRDGRYLIEQRYGATMKAEQWVAPLTAEKSGDRKPFAYLHADYNERSANLSPNRQWLACVSDENKRPEVTSRGRPTAKAWQECGSRDMLSGAPPPR